MGYFGARYYDNTSAMWLGVDPLWEKNAGMNPYNYCAGNPVMLVDRDGREPQGSVVKNRRDPNAVRTPGKGYNCGSDFYSAPDGGCTSASIKQYYEKWSVDYYSILDDNRTKRGYGSDINIEYRITASLQEKCFINIDIYYSDKGGEINGPDLESLMTNPNVDFIGTFDTHDPDAAVNTNPYHTMVIDSIELIYYAKGHRKEGQLKDILFKCFDSDTYTHQKDNDTSLRTMHLRDLKKLVKFQVDSEKLNKRDQKRNEQSQEQ